MIMTITDLRTYSSVDLSNISDQVLDYKLKGLESLLRKYTNNRFQNKSIRTNADIINGKIICESIIGFKTGDTIEVDISKYNSGLHVITSINENEFTCSGINFINEEKVLVTKIEYPSDIIMGVVSMFDWKMTTGDKVGISSESISRHSVSYFDMTGDNSINGYPKSLVDFLKPYKKARF